MTAAPASQRIWVTRTLPAARRTAAALAQMGHAPVVRPVLEAEMIAGAQLDLSGVDALALTSGHALSAFAGLCDRRDLTAYAVGEATAEQARALGFEAVVAGRGGAAALAEVIAGARVRPAKILIPTAAEPAADLVGQLADRGLAAVSVAVYRTRPTGDWVDPDAIDAILVHSARAAQLISARLAGHPSVRRLRGYAIAEAAAQPLMTLGLARLEWPAAPTDAALLALLA